MAWAVMLVAVGVSPVAAQPLAPTGPAPTGSSLEALPPAAIPNHPPNVLGDPIPIQGSPVRPRIEPFPPTPIETYREPPAPPRPTRAAGLGAPVVVGSVVPAASMDPVPSTAVETRVRQAAATPPPADAVNDFLTRRANVQTELPEREPIAREPKRAKSGWRFGENLDGLFGERGEWFRSDHAFDGFISPVTNPFLFEDPRSLTEVRPIFMYQKVPGGQPDFQGGNMSYFGIQARLAVTDRLSFVVNKLGGIWLSPGSGSVYGSQSGFAELWFGPKYTFIRNEDTGSLLAGGLQFQVPIGSRNAFQHTGSLSLVPYVSYAQNLFRDFSAGSFNGMVSTGYSFSTTSARSDYYWLSGHIDWDVMNCHRFYPLFELNYYLMSKDGHSTPIGSEGRDLVNFGGQASGKGLMTGAFGARFKVTENAQVGGAFEFPFAGPHDFFQYRFTLDFILRY
jgi:hypothetical protein